jgi:hypothetical protein
MQGDHYRDLLQSHGPHRALLGFPVPNSTTLTMSTNKPHDSVRSSPTLSTHNDAPDHGPTRGSDDPEARADLAERELHDEGGDEPNDPPVKDHGRNGPPPPSPQDEKDPNEVSWDGPNDPANPLNFRHV